MYMPAFGGVGCPLADAPGACRGRLLAELAAAEVCLEADALGGGGAGLQDGARRALLCALGCGACEAGGVAQAEALRQSGCAHAFPRVAAALAGVPAGGTGGGGALEAHLSFVASVGGLWRLCDQLEADASRPEHHKYVAHQLALLYQTLNQVRGELKPFKKQLEARFDDIKATTEAASAPQLSAEQAEWLTALCRDLRDAVKAAPGVVRQKVEPMMSLLSKP